MLHDEVKLRSSQYHSFLVFCLAKVKFGYFYIVYYKQTRNITPSAFLFLSVLAGSAQCLDQQIEENKKKLS